MSPRYVDSPNEVVWPQPYSLLGSRMYGFLARGDASRLQALCDRNLNGPAGGARTYRVLSDRVLLTFTHLAKLVATTPPYDGYGFSQEIDVAYWVLVGEGRELGPIFELDRLGWYVPFIFVDNSWAMLGGREVYGFPKQFARVTMPGADEPPARFATETLVLTSYAPSTELSWQTIVDVSLEAESAGKIASLWRTAEEAVRGIVGALAGGGRIVVPGPGLVVQLVEELLRHETLLVFLKQFRDSAQPLEACYQAVIEAPMKITAFHGGGLLPGAYRIRPTDFASQPLAAALGLPAGGTAAEVAFWVEFDSTIELGQAVAPRSLR